MDAHPGPGSAATEEYFVLQKGQVIGPMGEEELRARIESGEFRAADLLQSSSVPIWQPISVSLASFEPAAPEAALPASSAPSPWSEIFQSASAQIAKELRQPSLAFGMLAVALAGALWLLSHWPIFLWLPLLVLALLAAFRFLSLGKIVPGMGLLLVLVLAPAAGFVLEGFLWPKPMPLPPPQWQLSQNHPAPEAPDPGAAGQPESTEDSEPAPAIVSTPAPAPPVAASVSATPTLDAPADRPKPAQTAPALASNRSAATPPPTTPAPLPARPAPTLASASPPAAGDVRGGPQPDSIFRNNQNSFVVIKGAEGAGSGFICKMGDRSYLLTNIHVLAGMHASKFFGINGREIKVGAAEAAVGHDLIRLAIEQPSAPALEVVRDFSEDVNIGDKVVVLGNSGGGGVVTRLAGNLVGIGPDRIEVDAGFIPGNSGSPVLHEKSGRVIGIATYLTKRYEEFSDNKNTAPTPNASPAPWGGRGVSTTPSGSGGSTVVRRFAYRVDTITRWEAVNWTQFYADADRLRKISTLTGDIFDFVACLRRNERPSFLTSTLSRPATDWLSQMARVHISPADRLNATQQFLGSLRSMVRTDIVAADYAVRYSYFRDELNDEREVRSRLFTAFDEQAQKLASPSKREY